MKHLISLYDLTTEELTAVLDRAADLKALFREGERPPLLQGRVLAQLFEKPSLRTRNSFEAAMIHLGGSGIFMTTAEAGLNGRESLSDIARVLSSFSDVITMRTFSHQLIIDFARHSSCPVINGLSDDRHPCQALTDLLTIREVFGSLTDRHLVFVGDGNNVAMSLAIAAAMTGMRMTLAVPQGFEFTAGFLSELTTRFPGHQVRQTHDPREAVSTADIVYTDVWASMGQEDDAARRKKAFADFQVNEQLMAVAPAGVKFMHDLPAKRSLEVTDAVMDAEYSIVFQQAENRMHLARG
ncbi:MAG: ornithine carbamoyltransferase, partial [Planctomycetaceae bacterium]|nr:ornithine carbamoyltransferase [Planctomycetaceae bacterium]